MENNNDGLSGNHLKELEGVLGSLLTNQEIIMNQNKELISAKKNARIWKIVSNVLIWIVLPIIVMQYMPKIIESMMGKMGNIPGMEILNEMQKAQGGAGGTKIDMEALKEMKKQAELDALLR